MMDIKDFFEMQRVYEAGYLKQEPISNEMKTQQLALCAHAEISSMLSKTNLQHHHVYKAYPISETVNTIKYEAVDVVI